MAKGRNRPELLVIDDDDKIRRSLTRLLAQQGYEVGAVGSAAEGIEAILNRNIALALVDLNLPDGTGHDVIKKVRELSPSTAVVVVTGHGAMDVAFRVINDGACDYFEKPIRDWPRFYHVIRKSLELRQKDEEIEKLKARTGRMQGQLGEPFRQLIGNSSAMTQLWRDITRVGPLQTPVLVTGESGVGKEVVTRAVHAQSQFKDGPFMAINCAVLPRDLIEAELFGSEKGAYTSADKLKRGLCEVAENGTLFLDEIGELALDLQVKLLRVLEEREFRRVGGTRNLPLRARIVTATNVDLRQAVAKGRFREDLYYRLNVFEIKVPPLRDRLEDVPLLAYYFITRYNAEFHQHVQRISPRALARLEAHHWANNNVRELQNTIQRAVAHCLDEDEITENMVIFDGSERIRLDSTPAPAGATLPSALLEMTYQDAKQRVVHEFTVEYITRLLTQANGNITRAAEMAGMARPNFSTLMRRYGIDRPEPGPRKLRG